MILNDLDPTHRIDNLETLEALYGAPIAASLAKEADHIHPLYQRLIEASPFAVLATAGPEGLDASPRGDPAGFVRVYDEKTLLLPDRRGNNRIDSLRNILEDPRVALLFLIPGIGETLRINGRAAISIDPELLASFAMNGKEPRSVLVVTVERIYFQCSKAIVRSKLWDPATQIPRSALPSTGTMVQAMSKGAIDGVTYDRELPTRVPQQLY
jgi:PPOX class probable FMN-dependent enzyme